MSNCAWKGSGQTVQWIIGKSLKGVLDLLVGDLWCCTRRSQLDVLGVGCWIYEHMVSPIQLLKTKKTTSKTQFYEEFYGWKSSGERLQWPNQWYISDSWSKCCLISKADFFFFVSIAIVTCNCVLVQLSCELDFIYVIDSTVWPRGTKYDPSLIWSSQQKNKSENRSDHCIISITVMQLLCPALFLQRDSC